MLADEETLTRIAGLENYAKLAQEIAERSLQREGQLIKQAMFIFFPLMWLSGACCGFFLRGLIGW
jgi:hypothetical protein